MSIENLPNYKGFQGGGVLFFAKGYAMLKGRRKE